MGGPARSLAPYELSVYSQSGEDGVLCEILRRIGRERCHERFVEFGTRDGSETICGFLAYAMGWPGLFMEGEPLAGKILEQRWAGSDVRISNVCHACESQRSLGRPRRTCRTGGIRHRRRRDDYRLWQALDRKPLVLVIEYNGALPVDPDHVDVQEYRGDVGPGSSLGTLEALGATLGYHLVHTSFSGINAFFVRNDVAQPFEGLRIGRRAGNHFNTGTGALAPAWD